MIEKFPTSGFWPSLYEPLRQAGTRLTDWLAPASEASVVDNAYRIAVELPGVAEGDIQVTADDGVVTVRGEKKSSREESGEDWYFSERQFGSFSRSFRLPADADEAAVKAELKDGVLTVVVPQKSPAAAPKPTSVPISHG